MKTRTIISTTITLFLLIIGMGCEKETLNINKSLIGEWQLIEQNTSSGTPTQPESVNDGYILKFDLSGIIKTDLYSCDGKYSVSNNDNILTIQFNCQSKVKMTLLPISRLDFQGKDTLLLNSLNSDEPYIYIYKRLK